MADRPAHHAAWWRSCRVLSAVHPVWPCGSTGATLSSTTLTADGINPRARNSFRPGSGFDSRRTGPSEFREDGSSRHEHPGAGERPRGPGCGQALRRSQISTSD
jgi:hypothetical protein